MVEILYMFGSFSPAVFTIAALLCIAVGVLGYRQDKPCVVVVSLILGFGIGYFVSMAAWGEGIGTLYLGSSIGLLSLLASIKILPVKRFFLGGVSVFLACACIIVVIANHIGGTSVTYSMQSLNSGSYEDVAFTGKTNDVRTEYANILGVSVSDIVVRANDSRTELTIKGPAANLGQLNDYGAALAKTSTFEGINQLTVLSNTSYWGISLIIAAVFGVACGVLTMFKPKIMQIIGTSLFAAVFGSVFMYLGLGELGLFISGPIFLAAAIILQLFINRGRDTDVKVSEDYRAGLAADNVPV